MLVSDPCSRPARPARSRVLRLRGLPYRAVEDDILRFLAPLAVTRVEICRRNGRTTGEAYVQLSSRTEAGEALRTKNRQHLGNRYIEIFEAGESDIAHGDAATGGVARDPASYEATIVRVAGLPASASAQDVVDFLESVELRSGLDSITILSDAGGSSTTAIVEVADETAQQFALSRNNQHFGTSRLLVSPLTASERAIVSQASVQGISLRNLFAQHTEQLQSQPSTRLQQSLSGVISSDGSTLKLRGLPYSATVADILEFFQGFQLTPENVHLEVRDDRQGRQAGTGVAYVRFTSPEVAEQARHSRHKQMMGIRYIECMISTPGRPHAPRIESSPVSSPGLFPSAPPRQTVTSSQLPSSVPIFPGRLQEPILRSPGWAQTFSPQAPVRSAEARLPSAFQQPPNQPPPAMQQMKSVAAGGSQGVPIPIGLQHQQQRQQLLAQQQQQFAMQQHQLMMQQQAMQQWGGQQWPGAMTPLGLAQGWLRPYGMGPAAVGMSPRGPGQGGVGMGMPGEGMAYAFGPGPAYAWAPMHPANQPMLGAGVQPFSAAQQSGIGLAYPPVQSTFDTRLSHSPHGGRTPGRAPARTPFYQNPQSRLSQTQSVSTTQPASHPSVPSEVAVSTNAAAAADVSPEIVSDLEALALADDLGGRRLTPIVTHPISSPSKVILASVTRGRTSELTSAALAQMTQAVESDTARLPHQVEQSIGLPAISPFVAPQRGAEAITASEAATAYTTAGHG